MDDPPIESTALLLRRLHDGDRSVEAQLFALLYDDLRARAKMLMREQPAGHTLQPTALVNEAWLKLCEHEEQDNLSKDHFLRLATRAMRSVLVDHARARATDKRGGRVHKVILDEEHAELETSAETLLALDEALTKLQAVDEVLARVAEMRLFGGFEHHEIARMIGVSTSTVERAWKAARARLQRELDATDAG